MTKEKLASGMAFAAAAISVAAVAACSSAGATTATIQTMVVAPPEFSTAATEAARPTPQADRADSAGPALDELADAANETFAVLETLLQELCSRESASEEELSAARYLVERYEDLGFSVELQPLTIERISTENSGFSIETPVQEKFDAIPLTLTGIGTAFVPLAPVGLSRTEDLRTGDLPGDLTGNLTGKIALVR
jgi:hypothetical protein